MWDLRGNKDLVCMLGLHAEKVARYESYLQHTEHKYTQEKRIILVLSQKNCIERVLCNHTKVF